MSNKEWKMDQIFVAFSDYLDFKMVSERRGAVHM